MILLLILLSGGLIFIQCVWVLTDPRPIGEQQWFSSKLLITYAVEVGLLVPQVVSGLYFPWNLGSLNQLCSVFGLIIFNVGIILAVWAKLTMKKSWGMPGEHAISRQKKLVTSGPFAMSRNPIYVGLLLLTLGFALTLRSYFIFLVIWLFFYFKAAIIKEEKLLTGYFGKEYQAYLCIVPRYLR